MTPSMHEAFSDPPLLLSSQAEAALAIAAKDAKTFAEAAATLRVRLYLHLPLLLVTTSLCVTTTPLTYLLLFHSLFVTLYTLHHLTHRSRGMRWSRAARP